ncbi:MAG: aspartate ammonia-lyase, partial [Actinomycetota bacterium]|nr:aspartate ammonia-lyase [Actinomycetota bacterium]
LLEQSLMLVTSMTDYIGYEAAAGIAKQAHEERRTIREVALEHEVMTEAELDKVLDVKPMTEPGVPGRT